MLAFIRHGQTDANLNRINAGGEYDIPLNATGMEQARAFARANQALIETFDAVYVSPMIRAQQTAELVMAGHSKPFEIVEDLREWVLGEWSGVPWDDVPNFFMEDVDPPAGETKKDFLRRSVRALQHVSKKHQGKVLVVAHGGIWFSYAKMVGHDVLHIDNCAHHEICRIKLGFIEPNL